MRKFQIPKITSSEGFEFISCLQRRWHDRSQAKCKHVDSIVVKVITGFTVLYYPAIMNIRNICNGWGMAGLCRAVHIEMMTSQAIHHMWVITTFLDRLIIFGIFYTTRAVFMMTWFCWGIFNSDPKPMKVKGFFHGNLI